jgi:hypothetical protein
VFEIVTPGSAASRPLSSCRPAADRGRPCKGSGRAAPPRHPDMAAACRATRDPELRTTFEDVHAGHRAWAISRRTSARRNHRYAALRGLPRTAHPSNLALNATLEEIKWINPANRFMCAVTSRPDTGTGSAFEALRIMLAKHARKKSWPRGEKPLRGIAHRRRARSRTTWVRNH